MSSLLRSFLFLGDLVDRIPNPRNGYPLVTEPAYRFANGNMTMARGFGIDCRCVPILEKVN